MPHRSCQHVMVEVVRSFPCLIQIGGPNTSAHYPEFVEETSNALRRIKANEYMIALGDFNANVGSDASVWKDAIGQHGDASLHGNGRLLL